MAGFNILSTINSFFFTTSHNDYQETKAKLDNSPISESFLFLPALRWRSFSSLIKNLIWIAAIIIPFCLGLFFTAPLIGAALGLASVISLLFFSYEEKLIQVELNRYDLNEKLVQSQRNETIELNKITLSKENHQEWELTHELKDHTTWGLEENSKDFENIKDILSKPENQTRTKAVVEISKNIRQKSENILSNRAASKEKTNAFLIDMQKLTEKYPLKSQAPQQNKQRSLIIHTNPVKQLNLAKQTFTWIFHVRSIDDFRNYCQENLTKLLFLFQKIQANGLMIVCKVSTDDLHPNNAAITYEDEIAAPPSLQGAISNIQDAVLPAISDLNPIALPKENGWQLSFTVQSKNELSEGATKKILEAKNIDGNSSAFALSLLTFNAGLPIIEPEISKDNPPANHLALDVLDMSDIISEALVDDDSYNSAKNIIDSRETPEQRQERLMNEEQEFQELMSSLNL